MNVKVIIWKKLFRQLQKLLFFTEEMTVCKLDDVLIFFTGADRIPPLGFDHEAHVCFLHDQNDRFCTASTCDLELRLPCCHHENYGAFREAMVMSFYDNEGV